MKEPCDPGLPGGCLGGSGRFRGGGGGQKLCRRFEEVEECPVRRPAGAEGIQGTCAFVAGREERIPERFSCRVGGRRRMQLGNNGKEDKATEERRKG